MTTISSAASSNSPPPFYFVLSQHDEYVKPQPFCFVSYLWCQEPVHYRTGIFLNKRGKVRLFEGLDDEGQPCKIDVDLCFNKRDFYERLQWRVRKDLEVGKHCFNHDNKRWCTIEKLDIEFGRVFVKYEGETDLTVIDPLNLNVGDIPDNGQVESQDNNDEMQSNQEEATAEGADRNLLAESSEEKTASSDGDSSSAVSSRESQIDKNETPNISLPGLNLMERAEVSFAYESPEGNAEDRRNNETGSTKVTDSSSGASYEDQLVALNQESNPTTPKNSMPRAGLNLNPDFYDFSHENNDAFSSSGSAMGSRNDDSSPDLEDKVPSCLDLRSTHNIKNVGDNNNLPVSAPPATLDQPMDAINAHRPYNFALSKHDEYVKPEPFCLVSYLWCEEPVHYRTGIVLNKRGMVRFFEGCDEEKRPCKIDVDLCFNKRDFYARFQWRVRTDLEIGKPCFNHDNKRWCFIEKLDVEFGRVFVKYEGETDLTIIDPVNLNAEDVHFDETKQPRQEETNTRIPDHQDENEVRKETLPMEGRRLHFADDSSERNVEETGCNETTSSDGASSDAGKIFEDQLVALNQNSNPPTSSLSVPEHCLTQSPDYDALAHENNGNLSVPPKGKDDDLHHDPDKSVEHDSNLSALVPPATSDISMGRNSTRRPFHFELSEHDEYVKPEPFGLVSYLWCQEPVHYRTGIVLNKRGMVRFFEGCDEEKRPCKIDVDLCFNKKDFYSRLQWRVRKDLEIGKACFDHDNKRWCTIEKLDVEFGRVFVKYEGGTDLTIIDPVNLNVGIRGSHVEYHSIEYDDTQQNYQEETNDDLMRDERNVNCTEESSEVDADENGFNEAASNDSASSSVRSSCQEQLVALNQNSKSGHSLIPNPDGGGVVHENNDDVRSCNSSNANDDDLYPDLNDEAPRFDELGTEPEMVENISTCHEMDESDGLSAFEIKDCDEYIKPRIGDLITVKYFAEPLPWNPYRVGILCNGRGKVRFFNGGDGDIAFDDYNFVLNRQAFLEGRFRARPELKPGSRCFETFYKKYCVLNAIHLRAGSVSVQFDGETAETELAPDDLVAVPTVDEATLDFDVEGEHSYGSKSSPPARKLPRNKRKLPLRRNANRRSMQRNTQPMQKKLKFEEESYLGVFEYKDDDETSAKQYYIRGRLRIPVGETEPILIKGESVSYERGKPGFEIEQLEVNKSKGTHLYNKVVSGKDKAECKGLALKAEKREADRLGQLRNASHSRARSTSYKFRPAQPVVVLGGGDSAVIDSVSDSMDLIEVCCNGEVVKVSRRKVRPIGFQHEPVNLDEFWRANSNNLEGSTASYSEDPDFLLKNWKLADEGFADKCLKDFAARSDARRLVRAKINDKNNMLTELGANLTRHGASTLSRLNERDLGNLLEDFQRDPDHSDHLQGFKSRIQLLKKRLPNPNLLLLCGGFAPEVTAYKRLNAAPLGKVILQDIDLHAVGVAVAAHPDVEFCIVKEPIRKVGRNISRKDPGDVRILTDYKVVREVEVRTGGLHGANVTNPCQSFSKAGKTEGFSTRQGQLMWDCCTAIKHIETSSDMPNFLFENVVSTHEIDDCSNNYLPEAQCKYFEACASMLSASSRKRKFATNIPPSICSSGGNIVGKPPSLDGDQPELCACNIVDGRTRFVHPQMKKLKCLLHTKAAIDAPIWEQMDKHQEPVRKPLLPEEAERAMGYRDDEIGVTSMTAYEAVKHRIENHDVEEDGCLVSLRACASDPVYPITPVDDTRRLQLLGNSVCVTMLEALLWREQELFPPILDS